MTEDNTRAAAKLRIWQQNINKSLLAQQDLINNIRPDDYELILIQEPYMDHNQKTRASSHWRVVYPSTYYTDLSAKLNTNSWRQMDVPCGDVTAIQISGDFGLISIFNIYNDCTHSRNLCALEQYMYLNAQQIRPNPEAHMVWAGDFNRHHPSWDEPRNHHLFTRRALRESQILIDILSNHELGMALPKGLATLCAHRTKNWTRVDNGGHDTKPQILLASMWSPHGGYMETRWRLEGV